MTQKICFIICLFASTSVFAESEIFRIGVIGTDTSHVPAFVNVINSSTEGVYENMRVVAAVKAGIIDNPSSWDRAQQYAEEIEKTGVKIYTSADEMLENVDGVLLENVDGRPHMYYAEMVIRAKKPMFIDKPLAGNLTDAVRIYSMAQREGVPVFSASSLRYTSGFQAARQTQVHGADAWSPCTFNAKHPDFYWYGIHGVETLFTLMGQGCVSVSRTSAKDYDLAVGLWADGRIGTFRGIRAGAGGYGGVVFGDKKVEFAGEYEGYKPLCDEICKFFATGVSPIAARETLEIMAFMTAADESKKLNGAHVTLASVLEKAEAADVKTFTVEISEDGSPFLDGTSITREALREKLTIPADAENLEYRVILKKHPSASHDTAKEIAAFLGDAMLAVYLYE